MGGEFGNWRNWQSVNARREGAFMRAGAQAFATCLHSGHRGHRMRPDCRYGPTPCPALRNPDCGSTGWRNVETARLQSACGSLKFPAERKPGLTSFRGPRSGAGFRASGTPGTDDPCRISQRILACQPLHRPDAFRTKRQRGLRPVSDEVGRHCIAPCPVLYS